MTHHDVPPVQLEWDEHCAEIVEHVEDYLETLEPDYDPARRWAGGSWRIGRSSLHTGRIRDRARSVLPGWVGARADRHYAREARIEAADVGYSDEAKDPI